MDFELSEDQRALQEAARDLLDGYADAPKVRSHLASGDPHDPKLWAAMVEQGWMGIALDEDRGGLGLGWVEAAVLLEEVGRHTAPAPFLQSLLALDTLAAASGMEDWVGRLVTGDAVGCVAWSKDPHALTTNAATLTGRTDPVIGAPAADVAVVWTPTAVFAVDLGEVGRPDREAAMDGTRCLGWLTFDRTPAIELGDRTLAERLLNRGAVGYSAEMLGGAARVLEMTAEYAKDRVQFGQPIGSFQAVKHRCADMVVDVEGMRSTAWYAAWSLDAADGGQIRGGQVDSDTGTDATIAASAAKVWCSDAAKRVMASGLQVHGGIGFTWEHDLHLYLKRSQLDQLSMGNATFHRDRLASLLRAKVDAGQSVI